MKKKRKNAVADLETDKILAYRKAIWIHNNNIIASILCGCVDLVQT